MCTISDHTMIICKKLQFELIREKSMEKSLLVTILIILGIFLILLWYWWEKLENVEDDKSNRNSFVGGNTYYNPVDPPGPRFVRTIVYTNYREVREKIIKQIAFNETIRGKSNSEIYTKQGKIRATIKNEIDRKLKDVEKKYTKNETDIKRVILSQRLMTSDETIKANNVPAIISICNEYLNRKQIGTIRNLGQEWVSVNQFWNKKKNAKGDFVGVYILRNINKSKYYVGQATRVLFRVNQHFTGNGNSDVYSDYKFGDTFALKMVKLTESGYDDLDKLEKDTIAMYDSYRHGYNKTAGNG